MSFILRENQMINLRSWGAPVGAKKWACSSQCIRCLMTAIEYVGKSIPEPQGTCLKCQAPACYQFNTGRLHLL